MLSGDAGGRNAKLLNGVRRGQDETLLQTLGYAVLLIEMVNDARVVPMDGRAHIPDHMRQWRGDARGRWEGNTLVVESTNFTDKTSFRGSGTNVRLTERFTRVGPDRVVYE